APEDRRKDVAPAARQVQAVVGRDEPELQYRDDHEREKKLVAVLEVEPAEIGAHLDRQMQQYDGEVPDEGGGGRDREAEGEDDQDRDELEAERRLGWRFDLGLACAHAVGLALRPWTARS